MGGLFWGGGGGQMVCCLPPAPSKIIGGPGPPLPTPMIINRGLNRFYLAPTFTLIFRRGVNIVSLFQRYRLTDHLTPDFFLNSNKKVY